MCGLVGYFSTTHYTQTTTERMANTFTHRGTDDSGFWQDLATGIHISHRRLAIVDLSPAGHQPMHSVSGRYVIAFNGEIYNHLNLRNALEQSDNAPTWRGYSDTETLLAGIDAWGVENTLQRAIGMFAIALWDKHSQTLTLARDRIEEKPLYYGWQGDTFLFGSELKALKAHPAFTAAIDRDALCLYMRHCYIPAPHTIYHGIAKLPAGCTLSVSLAQREPRLQTYWSGMDAVHHGLASPFQGSSSEAVSALDTLLKDAVRQQMMADVPLGAFLSGGVDSSTVVALMQAQSSRPIKTFSIGFHETFYNEAEHAKAVAQQLDTIERMMALDILTYLPDDILCKVDRAAMGVSLETRVPFLDHRVVEFAWQLPMKYKLRDKQTKWVLRQVLYQYVPKAMIERPKMGFGVPIDSWLRGELRDWAEDLLSESRLQQDGYFNPAPIRQKWQEHLLGRRNWQHQLWNVLMFQA